MRQGRSYKAQLRERQSQRKSKLSQFCPLKLLSHCMPSGREALSQTKLCSKMFLLDDLLKNRAMVYSPGGSPIHLPSKAMQSNANLNKRKAKDI